MKSNKMKKIILVSAMLFSGLVGNAFAMDNKNVMISDAWLRVAPNKVAGAFFDIMNKGDNALEIVSAKTKGAKRTELHNHIMDDGVMRMRRVEAIEVTANSKLSFNPHGYHLMMFKLDADMFKVGEKVNVELTFADDSTANAEFMVKPFGKMKMKMDHSKMDDHKKHDHKKMDDHKKHDHKKMDDAKVKVKMDVMVKVDKK